MSFGSYRTFLRFGSATSGLKFVIHINLHNSYVYFDSRSFCVKFDNIFR